MKKIYVVGLMALALVFGQQAKALSYSAIVNQGKVLGVSTGFYPYPSGSLVNDNGTVYFISGTTKVPFANAEAFIGLGYSFGNVIQGDLSNYTAAQSYTINTVNMAHPWGSWLIYKGTVYYSAQSGLIGVPSSAVFTSNGGNWNLIVKANSYDVSGLDASLPILTMNDSRVITSPTQSTTQSNATTQNNNSTQSNTTSTTGQHPAGTLVNDNGTIYLLVDGGKLGIPDLSTFNSWNYSFNSAVVANSADKSLPQIGVVYPKGSEKKTTSDTTIQNMLNVSLDPSSAPSGTVTPGSVDVAVGAFKFSSSYGDATVNISGPVTDSSSCNFNDIKLFDASTGAQIGNTISSLAVSSGVCQGLFKNVSFLVPSNTSKTVVLKVTIPSSATGSFRFALGGITTTASNVIGAPVYGNTMTITLVSLTTNYDVNSDGSVNVADFQKEYNAVMGIDTTCGTKCDLNGDGAVNVADLQKMINYLQSVGTIPQPGNLSQYDVNSDGQVNVADFQKEYNAVMGIDTTCGTKCDLNGDGAVNVADLQKLINYLIGATSTVSQASLISSDSFVSFNVTQGTANPPVYNLHLTNSSSVSVNYNLSVPNQPSWLNCSYNTQTLSLNAGAVAGVCVAVDASKVSTPGTYTTNLVISGNFTNSPITIPVTLVVSPAVVATNNYDVNSDGAVNVADYQKVVNAVMGYDTTCTTKCDLNGDGAVNVADLQKIINYLQTAGTIPQTGTLSQYDVNSDGAVNVADFQKEYNAVMGIDSTCATKCDLNGDGAVNVADLQRIINYLIGVVPTTPTPTLSVVSPNGGESYKIGSTVTIQWNIPNATSGNNSFGLTVYDAATRAKIVLNQSVSNPVSGGQVSTSGSYSWTIPSTVAPGNYLVYISTNTGWDESNASFSITQ